MISKLANGFSLRERNVEVDMEFADAWRILGGWMGGGFGSNYGVMGRVFRIICFCNRGVFGTGTVASNYNNCQP